MAVTSFDEERSFDDEQFTTRTIFQNERLKVVLGFFEPGQFIPVHAPESDVTILVHSGHGTVRDASTTRSIDPGDAVVVEAGDDRGVRAADDNRLEAMLVTAPPPSDDEHAPVREGLARGVFDPTEELSR